MPYVTADRRIALSELASAESSGELNYLITRLIIDYCREKCVSYQTINDIMGALEGAKLEFYRRVAAPYEAHKIIENGDVY
jgi:hypothetical protein